MNLVKSNWFRIPASLLLLIFFWAFFGSSNNSNNQARLNGAIESPTPTPDNKHLSDLLESLPKFEDYPAKVYPIPPKPKLNHESHLMGMKYWTVTEYMVSDATEYKMSGHFLIDRYGTANPRVLIIDGLSGEVFHEYGGMEYETRIDSDLIMFDPFISECFSVSGDYASSGCSYGINPRYAVWTGKTFKTICEPIVKNWKLISCK